MEWLSQDGGHGSADMVVAANQAIHRQLKEDRLTLIAHGKPLVGDVVLWPNGQRRRISHHWGASYQTCYMNAGSFYASAGWGDFSGGHQPPVFAEFFVQTEDMAEEEFWFFSENRAGAGRGIRCMLPCRVWRLQPFRRTRQEAEAHQVAINAKEFWGTHKQQYEMVIESIMNPRVIDEPGYF